MILLNKIQSGKQNMTNEAFHRQSLDLLKMIKQAIVTVRQSIQL
jgi:hypothetical protein